MRAPQFAPFAERCSVAFFEGRSGADHAVRCCARERGHVGAHASVDGVDCAQLNEAQRDGRACLRCGGEDGGMVPVGRIDGVQVFVHRVCETDIAHLSFASVPARPPAVDGPPRRSRMARALDRSVELVGRALAGQTFELIADNVSEDGGLARELDRLAKELKR